MEQWMGIPAKVEDIVRPLVWEDPTFCRATKAHMPQLLKPMGLEPALPSKGSRCREKPALSGEEPPPPPLTATKEAQGQQREQKERNSFKKSPICVLFDGHPFFQPLFYRITQQYLRLVLFLSFFKQRLRNIDSCPWSLCHLGGHTPEFPSSLSNSSFNGRVPRILSR